jgi:phage gp36-like protein
MPNLYAAIDDLDRRLTAKEQTELTDDTNSNLVDETKLTGALTEASAEIEAYCRERYKLPLQASEKLEALCLDITVYKLFLRRRRVPDAIRLAYEDAIAFLKDVAAGKAGLDQQATLTEQSGTGSVQATQVEERFSDDHLSGYV